MMADKKLDTKALSWVSEEIRQSLNRSRAALETLVEDQTATGELDVIEENLRQVNGTLKMVGLFGGELLCEELINLVQALRNGKVAGIDDAHEALMRGIIQLPTYIENLQHGQRDIPIILLPLLNDIRALCGGQLLTESAFFSPDLGIFPDTINSPKMDIRVIAKKLRPAYQLSLVNLLRDKEPRESLRRAGTVLHQIERNVATREEQQLWWVACGLIESLYEQGLELNASIKHILTILDRRLKDLVASGEVPHEDNEEILKNTLYYVAQARSGGKRVSLLKKKFNLADLIPDAEETEKARNDLLGLDGNLFNNVAQAISDDMLQIKETLDVFSRSAERNVDRLEPVVSRLKTVADTLGMIGMGQQRSELIEFQQELSQAISNGDAIGDELLMKMASTLIVVENALGGEDKDDGIVVGQGDYGELVDIAATESRKVLGEIKDTINAAAEGQGNTDALHSLPAQIRTISGALHMIGRSDGAEQFNRLGAWLHNELKDPGSLPTAEVFAQLADVITGAEYFIDAVSDDLTGSNNALRVMGEGLDELGAGGGTAAAQSDSPAEVEVPPAETPPPEQTPEAITEVDLQQSIDSQEFEFDMVAEDADADIEADIDVSAAGLELTLDEEPTGLEPEPFEATIEMAPISEDLTPADAAEPELIEEAVISAPQESDDDIDDEVMEIFLEELQEETESINETLAAWSANAGDEEALGTLRRSFHTIKGSGRIVGASELGEFAWAIENMLNRLLDNAISRSPEMLQVLEMARDALPEFLQQLQGQGQVSADVDQISTAAHALAEGKAADVSATSGPIENGSESGGMDPVLAEIFTNETRNHLNTVNDWLGSAEGGLGQRRVTPELIRALHTLHGSSQMAGVMHLVGTTDCLEKYIKACDTAEHSASDNFVGVLADTMAAYQELLDKLTCDDPMPTGSDGLQARAESLLDEMTTLEQADDTAAVDADLDSVETLDLGDSLELSGGLELDDGLELEGGLELDDTPELNEGLDLDGGLSLDDGLDLNDSPDPLLEPISDFGSDDTDVFSADAVSAAAFDDFGELGSAQAMPVDVDPELVGVFIDEAEEILHDMQQVLDAWRAEPGSIAALQALQRQLHTLKGGARMAGVVAVGDLAHDIESVIMACTEGGASPDHERFIDVIQGAHDWLFLAMENLRNHIFLDRPEHLVNIRQALGDSEPEPAWLQADQTGGPDTSLTADELLGADQAWASDASGDAAALDAFDLDDATAGGGAVAEQYDEELLEIFLEEAGEILHNTDDLLHRWVNNINDTSVMQEIQRALHTLKGGARMAGVQAVGDLSHSIETAMEALNEGRSSNYQALLSLVQQGYDWLATAIEQIRNRQPLGSPSQLIRSIDAAAGAAPVEVPHTDLTAEQPVSSVAEEHAEQVDPVLAGIMRAADEDAPHTQEEAQEKEARTPTQEVTPGRGGEVVRISSDLLENLINNAGEMSIYRSRIDQQLGTMTTNLVELDSTVARIREQLRKFEIEAEAQILYRFEGSGEGSASTASFDPLELDRFSNMQQLSRSLAESVADLSSIQKFISGLTRETEILLVQQSRVNSELQNGLMRTRLLPFTSILPRLRRIVRQVSQELGKQVDFSVHGAEAEMDRSVLNRLIPALEHMLRNAIDHGLEHPRERKQSGKSATGKIDLSFTRVGGEIVLRIEDDGAGMNLQAIRKKAVERGLMNANSALSDDEVVQFVLEAGFSTAGQVTQISGRGVGMDVVSTEIKQLGGSLSITTKAGKGTRFTVHLPLTVSVNQALMVLVGEETYAIPLTNIVGITRLDKYELDRLITRKDTHYQYADEHFQFFHMGAMMGICAPRTIGEKERVPLILAHSGQHNVALLTEAILGRSEVVVKTVGPQISSVKGISGATIMGDGSVALILDVPNLIRASIAQVASVIPHPEEVEVAKDAGREPIILVVDDSITVRKVTERLLKRHNLVPVTAKDGLDALDKLEEITPDLILSDIEMPRMDGYEFITNVKKDPRFDAIPVIMITSRTGDKHRDRAMGLGVNLYMGKPFQETELLQNINSLIDEQVESE